MSGFNKREADLPGSSEMQEQDTSVEEVPWAPQQSRLAAAGGEEAKPSAHFSLKQSQPSSWGPVHDDHSTPEPTQRALFTLQLPHCAPRISLTIRSERALASGSVLRGRQLCMFKPICLPFLFLSLTATHPAWARPGSRARPMVGTK